MEFTRRHVLKVGVASTVLAAGARINVLRAQEGPIRIGVMYGLSGPGAPVGEALLAGTRFATEHVNKNGGLLGRQIELVVRDDKYNGAAAVAAARELVGEGINLMIGGSQTVTALGVLPLLPELGAMMVSPAAAGMAITHELFNRHIFRTTPNAHAQYSALARALVENHPGVVDWAMVVPEGEYGRDVARSFAEAVKKYVPAVNAGASAVVHDPIVVSATGTDFRAAINGVMSTSAEGLFIGVVGAPQISLLQQARSVGLYDKMKVIGEAGNEAVLAQALQKNLPQNIWAVSYGVTTLEPLSGFPIAQQLQADYVASGKTGAPPGLTLCGHRGALTVFAGIKAANSTKTNDVITALEGLTFDTAGGPYSIRKEDHQGLGTGYYVRMRPDDAAPFFAIDKQIGIDIETVVEPATPGVKF